jgi:(1->4)-alpha-D-glucan 1-alpha-D-glucosylmutase
MIPRATYRLQFHKEFPFDAALPLAPYLQRLGISHVYASPILKARARSMHGYDVIDCSVVNPELGGDAGFRELVAELRAHDVGVVLDIVPNHMAVHSDNRWWMDVLEHGWASRFAQYFDIDWDLLDGKVLTAFLGKPYWKTLEAGEIEIARDEQSGKLCAVYFDWHLPLRPEDQGVGTECFRSPDDLHKLLERQHFRLACWRTANDTINWRRFFDIPDLIALNQDDEAVFEATHAKIFDLYREGLIDGVRVDHIDGLADPASYCQRLRARLDELASRRREPDVHPYIVVEKILGAGESLPRDWGVDGTTGYDFMNEASALQHDPAGAEPLGSFWHQISNRPADFEDEEKIARCEIVQGSFESALTQTTDAFFAIAQQCKSGRDLSRAALRRGLVHILQHLRVYRTYATGKPDSPPSGSQFDVAVARAEHSAGGTDLAAIRFIADLVNGEIEDLAGGRAGAVRRFNQLSAPVAAKAVEDTAFYRYSRLLSRNDVGFDPGTFSRSPDDFHAAMAQRARSLPHAMLATATHDHKRGEDVRARLAVLSEMPGEWTEAVQGWMRINTAQRQTTRDESAEYQLYQMLAGAWPLGLKPDDERGLANYCERTLAWRQKALREAKLRTSWLDPDEGYENADAAFVRTVLDPAISREFLSSIAAFVQRIAPAGALNALVQATLRYTVPGVPDCYQGTEFWDLSLVDPDNRRPVDYGARIEALHDEASPIELLSRWQDGHIKQAVIATLLNVRRQVPKLFSHGMYVPLGTNGPSAKNVLAFARQTQDSTVIVAVPLHCARECDLLPLPQATFWADTSIELPSCLRESRWTNLFDCGSTNQSDALNCCELFRHFPVAVLI